MAESVGGASLTPSRHRGTVVGCPPTAAGVSAGIDMAIRLVELLVDDVAAQAAQTLVEYDPHPPFAAGHPSRVGPEVMERIAEYAAVRK